MSLAVRAVNSDINPKATAHLLTPYTTISKASCLSFRYFAQTRLITSLINPKEYRILADFVATGRDFHLTLLDLPSGTYRFVWETLHAMVNQRILFDKEFLVAIDDVIIFDMPCCIKRKLQLIPTLFFSSIFSLQSTMGDIVYTLKHDYSWSPSYILTCARDKCVLSETIIKIIWHRQLIGKHIMKSIIINDFMHRRCWKSWWMGSLNIPTVHQIIFKIPVQFLKLQMGYVYNRPCPRISVISTIH